MRTRFKRHPILYRNVSACRADMENFKTDTQRESVANFPAQGPSGRMSVVGHLQTSRVCPAKSALPLRADIEAVSQPVGFGPETVVDTSALVELSDIALGI
jgi:hypothetical protein